MSKARPKQVVTPLSKECSKCGTEKPASDYITDLRHADGLRSECKECFYTKTRYLKALEWRRANPERIRVYNKRSQPAREAWLKRWRKEHPEEASEWDRRKHARERAKAPVGYRVARQVTTELRRARKKSTGPNDLTRHQWETIKATYNHCCAYCGKKQKRLTMDHVIPLVKSGHHTASNVVPACVRCNVQKHDKDAPSHQPHLIR